MAFVVVAHRRGWSEHKRYESEQGKKSYTDGESGGIEWFR
jgi:hypothetical protein